MKIAIVGTSDSAKEAPYSDASWQIWSLGRNHIWIPRFDKFFEVHTMAHLASNQTQKIYYDHLERCGDRLILREPAAAFPNAQILPRDDIIKNYSPYITSSIAWMFLMALYSGATEIGIWGCDMRGDNEYAHQRPCLEFWIGRAIERGVKVSVHHTSALLKGEVYCEGIYYQVQNLGRKANEEAEESRDHANYQRGYADAFKFIKSRFG